MEKCIRCGYISEHYYKECPFCGLLYEQNVCGYSTKRNKIDYAVKSEEKPFSDRAVLKEEQPSAALAERSASVNADYEEPIKPTVDDRADYSISDNDSPGQDEEPKTGNKKKYLIGAALLVCAAVACVLLFGGKNRGGTGESTAPVQEVKNATKAQDASSTEKAPETTFEETEPEMTEETLPETTLPAIWYLSFNANGGKVNETLRELEEGEVIGTLPMPTRLGYSFEGWYTAASGGTKANEQMVMGSGDVDLYAHWKELKDPIGSKVSFGTYEQDNNLSNGPEEIIWEVFTYYKDVVWVISDKILDAQPYNVSSASINWPNSSLRYWLNNEFYNAAFTKEERSYLVRLDVDGDYNPVNGKVYPGDTVDDYVAIFSYHEMLKYFKNASQVQCQGTAYAKANGLSVADNGFSPYWTRTPGIEANLAVIARSAGDYNVNGREVEQSAFGVRPLLCIKVSAFK